MIDRFPAPARAAWLCLLLALPGHASADARPPHAGCDAAFDPSGRSIVALADALDAGRTTSVCLVEGYLRRIARYDRQGPTLHAVVALAEDAREQARRLDEERRRQGPRGPLHGIPFLVKDNIDVRGMATAAGSATLTDVVPRANAFVVGRLVAAGAIVLGKTHMSELASSNGRYGYGSRAGTTRNPYDLRYSAAGSSSGSGAALAAGFAAFTLGTDSYGSVRAPASVTSSVGIRPTLGLTSRSGVLPLSLRFDVVGPLTRTVEDLALVLRAMAGEDAADPATVAAQADRRRAALAPPLQAGALRGARLAVPEDLLGTSPALDPVVASVLAALLRSGATLVPVQLPESLVQAVGKEFQGLTGREFVQQLEAYLRGVPTDLDLGDIVRRAESPAIAASPYPLNPATLRQLRAALDLRDQPEPPGTEAEAAFRAMHDAVRLGVLQLLDTHRADALVFPTLLCPPMKRHDVALPAEPCKRNAYEAAYIASAALLPEITFPGGYTASGLPVGISLLGRPFDERRLLDLAHASEHALSVHRPAPATPPLE